MSKIKTSAATEAFGKDLEDFGSGWFRSLCFLSLCRSTHLQMCTS